jgi:hypothetical protein
MNLSYNQLHVHFTLHLKVRKRTLYLFVEMYLLTKTSIILVLNRPFPRQKSISPDDLLIALERKFDGTINRDQQVRLYALSLLYFLLLIIPPFFIITIIGCS